MRSKTEDKLVIAGVGIGLGIYVIAFFCVICFWIAVAAIGLDVLGVIDVVDFV